MNDAITITLVEYLHDERRWFAESLERAVVVVDEDGVRLFGLELVRLEGDADG